MPLSLRAKSLGLPALTEDSIVGNRHLHVLAIVAITIFAACAKGADLSAYGDCKLKQIASAGGGSEVSGNDVSCWDEISVRSQARVEEFFELVNAQLPDDALGMLSGTLVATEADKRAWREQLEAIKSIHVQDVQPVAVADWTPTRHFFKVILEAYVSQECANAPIPYYGWHDNPNIRWVMIENMLGQWLISGISTGP